MSPRHAPWRAAIVFLLLLTVLSGMVMLPSDWAAAEEAGAEAAGRFMRSYWYERGIEHGNPYFDGRFRVNAPEVVLNPSFMHRSEVRENGMMVVLIDENLGLLAGADLHLELWGGHPGTSNKRVTVNGRSAYNIPEVGTEADNCTYSYPTLPLKITDLVNGYNALQFACDQGTSFWGHYIVDNARLGAVLKSGHPDLEEAGLGSFTAAVDVQSAGEEALGVRLNVPPSDRIKVASVEFVGRYDGYDENGNGKSEDWHGFTKDRNPTAILGIAKNPPFSIHWDLSMLPTQDDVAVKATVRFKDHPEIAYETPVAGGISIPPRERSKVRLYTSEDLPHPFWSRASKVNECTIVVSEDPARIERAELHVVIWDGGRGNVGNPFTLNGNPLPVAGDARHDVLYRKLPLERGMLQRGANRVAVLSDTDHHGIEVLLPGPAIVVRSKR